MARPTETTAPYSPLYFLASLGAGGLTVTFFMWLLFWVPHPGRPVPVFEDIAAAFAAGPVTMQAMIAVALLGIAACAAVDLRLLVWNLRQMHRFARTPAYAELLRTNAATQVMAMPLALAMSLNVGFILGLVFVPGLWRVVEWLFPPAMLAFLAIGWLAFRQLGAAIGSAIAHGGFDHAANNSFAQKLPAFALAMVGVGLAAPAAMSTNALTAGVSLVLSSGFLAAAAVIALVALVMGTRAMLEQGVAPEAAPTLMVIVPILTVLGILILRQQHGLGVHFDSHPGAGDTLVLLTRLMAVQLLFTALGLVVMGRIAYWRRFVFGDAVSPGAYALICPGVALSVMGQFWINKGLVAAGLVAAFSPAYWALSLLAVALQFATLALAVYLNRRHFPRRGDSRLPAAG